MLSGLMLFVSGRILYLIFRDIDYPPFRFEKHWAFPLGAVFDDAIAVLGEMLIHSGS